MSCDVVAVTYRDQLEKMMIENNTVNQTEHCDGKWNQIKQSLITCAEEIIGYEQKKERNEWYDEECKMSRPT